MFLVATGGNLPQQRRGNDLTGGIIGIAQHQQLPVKGFQHRQKCFGQGEIVLLPQGVIFHAAIRTGKGGTVLRKGGHGQQRLFGLQGAAQCKNQLCRPVAAEDGVFVHTLVTGNGCHQLPAIGVGVLEQQGQGIDNRLLHRLRRTQGVDVGGKIQRNRMGVYFTPMGILNMIEHRNLEMKVYGRIASAHKVEKWNGSMDGTPPVVERTG